MLYGFVRRLSQGGRTFHDSIQRILTCFDRRVVVLLGDSDGRMPEQRPNLSRGDSGATVKSNVTNPAAVRPVMY
jgi:hypothetical protein